MGLAKVDLVFRYIPETYALHQNFANKFNPIPPLFYTEVNYFNSTVFLACTNFPACIL